MKKTLTQQVLSITAPAGSRADPPNTTLECNAPWFSDDQYASLLVESPSGSVLTKESVDAIWELDAIVMAVEVGTTLEIVDIDVIAVAYH